MAKRQGTNNAAGSSKKEAPDTAAQTASAQEAAVQQDPAAAKSPSAEDQAAAAQIFPPQADDLQEGAQAATVAESPNQADIHSAIQNPIQLIVTGAPVAASLENTAPGWLQPTAFFEVLTPFKFRGRVVKPRAWIELPIEEAPLYLAAGVVGDKPRELPDDTE
ncbi:MAG: hypothetical protein ACREPC_03145 [Stenotrophomonas sp.]|uniref:hypothetical protein n=1 Tax=Stenotrophomonas sp. TaxID=69392 RepID=UPI003D6D55B3